jgi:hypothetical protein
MFLTQPSEDALPKPAAAAGRGRGRPRGPSGASRSSAQPGIAPAAEASRLPESWGRLQNKDERFLADNGDSYEDPDEEGRLHLAGPAPPAPAPGPRGRPAPPSRGRAKAMALISTPPPGGGTVFAPLYRRAAPPPGCYPARGPRLAAPPLGPVGLAQSPGLPLLDHSGGGRLRSTPHACGAVAGALPGSRPAPAASLLGPVGPAASRRFASRAR